MNCTALSAAVVALLVAVIAVSVVVDGYSPTSTKFDWSPNRNSQDTVRKGGAGKDSSVELAGFESGSSPLCLHPDPNPGCRVGPITGEQM